MISLQRENRFDSYTFPKDRNTGTKVDNEFDRLLNFVNGITTGAFAQSVALSLFGQTATGTVANVSGFTSVVSTGVGITTLPANFLKVGRTILLQASGTYKTKAAGAGTFRVELKIGSVVIVTSALLTLVDNQADQFWTVYLPVTCRTQGNASTGSVICNGYLAMYDGTNGMRFFPMSFPTATLVDTTIAEKIDLLVNFGTSDPNNSFSATNLTIISE